MQLVFLGTSCMVPTKERNVSGVFLSYKNHGILFDCGEGTQRQMSICGIKRNKVNKVLISHWHGDHVSGLIGLIQTLGNDDNSHTVEIYGPKETKLRMEHMLKTCIFDQRVELKIHEINPKGEIIKIFENDEYYIEAANLDHKVPCLGFTFVEKDKIRISKAYLQKHNIPEGSHMKKLQAGKDITIGGVKHLAKDATYRVNGKKVSYIADTISCKGAVLLAEDSDVMICEACYDSSLEEKGRQYFHMTAKEAGLIASQNNVKELILTHFSQRYKDVSPIQDDAKVVFDNVRCADDFMKINL